MMRPGEVTNSAFAMPIRPRRVMPNFFGQSRAAPRAYEVSRGLMGLSGGVEDYKGDSSAMIEAKIAGFRVQLARAKEELGACADAGRVIVGVLTAGLTSTECYLKWSGQVGYFEDRITEAVAALGIAQLREKTAKASAKASADAAAKAAALEVASQGSAETGSKAKDSKDWASTDGIPTWAKALGGAVLLGGLAFVLVRKKR